MTTSNEIAAWFDAGVAQGATHMIVACDTFSHDDYPVYVRPDQDVRLVESGIKAHGMQRIMEVYHLKMDQHAQLSERRAFNYDVPAQTRDREGA